MGVVILAGPSGSGKSHLVRKLGWSVLRLDDFYRDVGDPGLPMSSLGIPDWDDPRSWNGAAAVAAIVELCRHGSAQVPTYDIARSRAVGTHVVTTDGRPLIAEGLFAPQIVAACRDAGVLDHAICLRRNRYITFVLRLARDLREGRKSPLTLVRRGWRLLRDEPEIIADAVAQGCVPMHPRDAYALLSSA